MSFQEEVDEFDKPSEFHDEEDASPDRNAAGMVEMPERAQRYMMRQRNYDID